MNDENSRIPIQSEQTFVHLTTFFSVENPDPGSGVFFTGGSGIRDEYPRSFFREITSSVSF